MKKIDLTQAKKILLEGGVIAIPTETVYGLAGWIESPEGLKKIFATKGRPFFDPLIVHVDSIEKARKLSSEWTEAHEALAEYCWPGPLTLIAKKQLHVDPMITAGLDSVGIRCPDHPLTLELLRQIEGGLAAPSANKFGKTSPSSALHVYQEFGDEVSIIDGGNCTIGIESTVVGIKKVGSRFEIEVFRPGHFTASQLIEILRKKKLQATVTYAQSPVAPGQLKHHYMPKIPLVIIPAGLEWSLAKTHIEKQLGKIFTFPKVWILSPDPRLASRELYQNLREFDEQGFDIILTSRLPQHSSEEWLGIWNRLDKAQSLSISE